MSCLNSFESGVRVGLAILTMLDSVIHVGYILPLSRYCRLQQRVA
jgi:hypothetical protein